MKQHAEDQDRQDRADRTEGDQAEAVGRGMAVTSDGRDTDTERHNEWHRHRAGRHSAGIEGHAPEAVRHEAREDENEDVAAHEDRRECD